MPLRGMVAIPRVRVMGVGRVAAEVRWFDMRMWRSSLGELRRVDKDEEGRVERWFRRDVRVARLRSWI